LGGGERAASSNGVLENGIGSGNGIACFGGKITKREDMRCPSSVSQWFVVCMKQRLLCRANIWGTWTDHFFMLLNWLIVNGSGPGIMKKKRYLKKSSNIHQLDDLAQV